MSTVRVPHALSLAAAVVAAALVWAAAGARTQAAAPPQATAPAASTAAAPTTPEAQEHFLRDAEVVASKQLGKGVTHPWRLTLKLGGVSHDAAFQSVDRAKDEVRFQSGRTERNFRDFYGYNIAAYRLARAIGYPDLVPATIARRWKSEVGALTWWVDKKWDEDERQKAAIQPPDMAAWERQLYVARLFTQLVADSDRNLGNQLVTADFHLWLIDFTRAFRLEHEPKNPSFLRRIERRLYDRLKAMTDKELEAAVGEYVVGPELLALKARRAALVAHYDALVAERGAAAIFFDTPSSQEHP